jgi:hypothetical protein
MGTDHTVNSRSRIVGPLAGIGGRAAASALRPLTNTMGVAVDRVLDSGEPERIVTAALNDVRVQATLRRALASNGARRLIDSFFDSGLFDHFIERLMASDALWRLVDEIAQSPSVRAAVSQQGLGFADQIGGAVRDRSRKADHRIEHSAGRLTHRQPNGAPPDADAPTP